MKTRGREDCVTGLLPSMRERTPARLPKTDAPLASGLYEAELHHGSSWNSTEEPSAVSMSTRTSRTSRSEGTTTRKSRDDGSGGTEPRENAARTESLTESTMPAAKNPADEPESPSTSTRPAPDAQERADLPNSAHRPVTEIEQFDNNDFIFFSDNKKWICAHETCASWE